MPKQPKEKRGDLLQRVGKFLWVSRIEILSGLLVLIGLILAIFYIYIGDLLVGLGTGIYFFRELHRCFFRIKGLYAEGGIFKILMVCGVLLYFLIAIPIFVFAVALGYAAMALFNYISFLRQ